MIKTVKSAKVFGDGNEYKGKTYYSVWVTFTDGFEGLASATSPTPPYREGDIVEVTDKGTKTSKGKPKISVKKTDQAPEFDNDQTQTNTKTQTVFGGNTMNIPQLSGLWAQAVMQLYNDLKSMDAPEELCIAAAAIAPQHVPTYWFGKDAAKLSNLV